MLYTGLIFTLPALADEAQFTNKDFLQMPDAHKKFWIQGAMRALGAVSARNNTQHGKCVTDWYFGEKQADRNGLIIGSMEKYPSYSPDVIFIFLTEQACGKYYN